MINLNNIAKQISAAEGKKVQIDIAQIKEILKITLTELSKEHSADVLSLIRKYEPKK